jgi:hypothetical protein
MREITKLRPRRFPVTEGKEDMMVVGSSTDGKSMSHDHAKSMPNAVTYPTMDSYGHYRSLVMAASLPNETGFPPESFSQDHPFSAGYSDWDQKIIDRAAELCGFKARKLSDGYSKEADDIHRASPTNHNSGKHPKGKSK